MELSNGERLLTWPLAQHVITAGWTYSNGDAHSALDFRASVGTPVYASESGTVNWVQTWDSKTKTGNQSYGNLVRIRHSDYNGAKLETYYAHLSKIVVSNGQTVTEGQLIGYSGNTGYSTGPHLHYEVRLAGGRVNPLNWLDADFTTAYSYVNLGAYKSVERPAEPAQDNRLQRVYIGPVTQGDADAVMAVCVKRGLTEHGLYRSEWANDEHTLQRITVGPVSRGDADALLICCVGRDLTDAGLYRSEWV